MPLFSLVLVFSSSVQIPLDGCPEIHMQPPFSPADEATTSKRQLDPLPSQLSQKTEQKKKKKIHNAETHIRELQSSINMIKIFVLLTIMDITQSVDPRNNIFFRADEYVKKCLVCWKERLHAARTFSRSRNPMGGTPYLQMWYVYLIRSSYQWIIQQGYMSQRNNSSSFFVLHSWTTILQPNFSYSHHDRSTHAKDVLLVHGKSCSSIDYTGWNSSWTLQLCDWKKNRIRCCTLLHQIRKRRMN